MLYSGSRALCSTGHSVQSSAGLPQFKQVGYIALKHLNFFCSFERALSDATEALRLEPSLEKALYRRACALEKMELFGRARLDLQHLLDVNANSDDAKQMLKRLQGKVCLPLLKNFKSLIKRLGGHTGIQAHMLHKNRISTI